MGMRTCTRCRTEKPENHYFSDERGTYWCMLCCYEFLQAHQDESAYSDAREFTAEQFRFESRSPQWVLTRLREGISRTLNINLSPLTANEGHARFVGDRMATAVRLQGERAFLCEACEQKFGGETVFKSHRKYGTTRGRPAPGATLKCFSLENSRYIKDENNVWRSAGPQI